MGGGRGMPLLTRCGSRVGRNAVMHNTAFRRCGRMCDRIIDRLKMPPQVQDAMLRPVPVVRGLVGDHVKPAAPSGPTKTIVDGLVVTIGLLRRCPSAAQAISSDPTDGHATHDACSQSKQKEFRSRSMLRTYTPLPGSFSETRPVRVIRA